MFGRKRPEPTQPVSPLWGGIAGTVIQNLIARRLAGKIAARAGGLPGMLLGMGATWALNRYLFNRNATRARDEAERHDSLARPPRREPARR